MLLRLVNFFNKLSENQIYQLEIKNLVHLSTSSSAKIQICCHRINLCFELRKHHKIWRYHFICTLTWRIVMIVKCLSFEITIWNMPKTKRVYALKEIETHLHEFRLKAYKTILNLNALESFIRRKILWMCTLTTLPSYLILLVIIQWHASTWIIQKHITKILYHIPNEPKNSEFSSVLL